MALIFKDVFRSKKVVFDFKPRSFEYVPVMLTISGIRTIVITIYRPGSMQVNENFWTDFNRLMELLIVHNCNIVVLGDINLHLDDHGNAHAKKFIDLLDGYDLVQNVLSPTHTAGHTLDVVITTRSDRIKPEEMVVHPPDISDHSLIVFNMPLVKPKPASHYATVRGWKKMDMEAFRRDLVSSDICS